ncbi:MAG: competence protein ComEA [Thiomicrorhabdus sp.]|nr:MAG: competence protein ComEA [Thiomicrorhabdus sp.]
MFNKYFICIFLLIFTLPAAASTVNVNTASIEEIASNLSGIGPAKAKAISEHCQKVTCNQPEDLLAVKGIGAKTLEKITADLTFEDK